MEFPITSKHYRTAAERQDVVSNIKFYRKPLRDIDNGGGKDKI